MEYLFKYLLEYLFGLCWFLFIIFGMIFMLKKHHIPMYKNYWNATNGIVNHNPTLTKFVYKVYMSKEEIISSLKIINVKDELSCAFDFERNIIIFSGLEIFKKEFFYEIQECDGFSILKLRQATLYGSPNFVFKINPFMVSKINAEIIPFSQYGN